MAIVKINSSSVPPRIYFGTCSTAAATNPKVCTVETFQTITDGGVEKPRVGTVIAVKFSNTNSSTSTTPQLDVNGLGAARIYQSAAVLATSKSAWAGTANQIIYYMWDGTYWVVLSNSVGNSNTTYSEISTTEANSTSSSTTRLITGRRLNTFAKVNGQTVSIGSNSVVVPKIATIPVTSTTSNSTTTYDCGELTWTELGTIISSNQVILLNVNNGSQVFRFGFAVPDFDVEDAVLAYIFACPMAFWNVGISYLAIAEGENDGVEVTCINKWIDNPDWGETNPESSSYIRNKPTNIADSGIQDVYISNGAISIGYDELTPATTAEEVAALPDYERQYFTIKFLTNGSISSSNFNLPVTLWYSKDGGKSWWGVSTLTTALSLSAGDKIMLKNSTSTPGQTTSSGVSIAPTGDFEVEGNIMSLYYGDSFIGQTNLSGLDYSFYGLFKNRTNLKSAKNLVLPATTLGNCSYKEMFYGCTGLVEPPTVLPATTLATPAECYRSMFYGCTALTRAPKILVTNCGVANMYGMFYGCTGLVEVDISSLTDLGLSGVVDAFNGCTSLKFIKCLATNLGQNGSSNWVNNVAASGIFVKADTMNSWTTGVSGIPSGWTVYNASEYEYARKYEIPADFVTWTFTSSSSNFSSIDVGGHTFSEITNILSKGKNLHIRLRYIGSPANVQEKQFFVSTDSQIDSYDDSNYYTAYRLNEDADYLSNKSSIIGSEALYLTEGTSDAIDILYQNLDSLLKNEISVSSPFYTNWFGQRRTLTYVGNGNLNKTGELVSRTYYEILGINNDQTITFLPNSTLTFGDITLALDCCQELCFYINGSNGEREIYQFLRKGYDNGTLYYEFGCFDHIGGDDGAEFTTIRVWNGESDVLTGKCYKSSFTTALEDVACVSSDNGVGIVPEDGIRVETVTSAGTLSINPDVVTVVDGTVGTSVITLQVPSDNLAHVWNILMTTGATVNVTFAMSNNAVIKYPSEFSTISTSKSIEISVIGIGAIYYFRYGQFT